MYIPADIATHIAGEGIRELFTNKLQVGGGDTSKLSNRPFATVNGRR